MSYEEELRITFRESLSIILTLIVVIVYLGLFAVYAFNRPDATLLNMSPPLLYTIILWFILIASLVIAAWKVWR